MKKVYLNNELIDNRDRFAIYAVTGGYLYRSLGSNSLCFVPDANVIVFETEQERQKYLDSLEPLAPIPSPEQLQQTPIYVPRKGVVEPWYRGFPWKSSLLFVVFISLIFYQCIKEVKRDKAEIIENTKCEDGFIYKRFDDGIWRKRDEECK